jgi:HNH endonuclease
MRPVSRGVSPQTNDFSDYRDAFDPLHARLGPYCSFCERRIPTMLAVEHIQPKDKTRYPELEGRWDNYLLACVNCNSTKGSKDVRPDLFYLPDRDNTLAAFLYRPDGAIDPARPDDAMAIATLKLTGLDKPIREVFDENGRLVASDRIGQRMQAWMKATRAKELLRLNPNAELIACIVGWAVSEGFFSVWMSVFSDFPDMRRRFIEGFPNTAADCFDPTTAALVSPRPRSDLTGGSKI